MQCFPPLKSTFMEINTEHASVPYKFSSLKKLLLLKKMNKY